MPGAACPYWTGSCCTSWARRGTPRASSAPSAGSSSTRSASTRRERSTAGRTFTGKTHRKSAHYSVTLFLKFYFDLTHKKKVVQAQADKLVKQKCPWIYGTCIGVPVYVHSTELDIDPSFWYQKPERSKLRFRVCLGGTEHLVLTQLRFCMSPTFLH